MSARRGLLSGAACLAAFAPLLAGCAGNQVKLTIRSPEDLNENRPLYVLVRQVDPKTYVDETYQSVASKVMAPDDSVLGSAVLFPGSKAELEWQKTKKGVVAVYVLFTTPTGEWKAVLPESEERVELALDANRMRPPERR
jgi:hypothetical protein